MLVQNLDGVGLVESALLHACARMLFHPANELWSAIDLGNVRQKLSINAFAEWPAKPHRVNPAVPTPTTAGVAPRRPIPNRWWIYQQERFPLFAHGLLIAAFSSCAVSFSFLLRGDAGGPAAASLVTAFVTAFILFLQLRVADEFKDFEEDARFRPYRPVPRGLVELRELAWVAAGGAVLQLGLAWWLAPRLVLLLLVTWAYLALMTREFFVRDWIRERPVTYLWTHMLIIPLTDYYATACDWQSAGAGPPAGLFWFIAVSFFNGVTLELGRKIRAPEDEEMGVRTYSRLWGRRWATSAWLGALLVTAACAMAASGRIDFVPQVATALVLLLVVALFLGWQFLAKPIQRHARMLERFSGLWTLILYLSLGLVPLLWRLVGP
jgi:4-hydroxybenzoate polyprenyltransferase